MMAMQTGDRKLCSYAVNLDKRVRVDPPLRQVAERIDFPFERDEVNDFYGKNG